jgi:hypothetical protein
MNQFKDNISVFNNLTARCISSNLFRFLDFCFTNYDETTDSEVDLNIEARRFIRRQRRQRTGG